MTKNALKFTHNGVVTIKTSYDYDNELLKVHIVDNGKGISSDNQRKLFVAFGKLPGSCDDNLDGAGMGLAISKRIVVESGGTIDVFSRGENKGTTFMFSMKMKLDSDFKVDSMIEEEPSSNKQKP